MHFNSFLQFLNSFYIEEVEAAQRSNNRERIARMVFNVDLEENQDLSTESNRRQAMRTARCVKILGKGVVKVVHRCDAAKESNELDLSDCQLMQMPDAIYHLMRNTTLVSCSLADNTISKIPPKFPLSFNQLTELNLANNRVSVLPQEMAQCTHLQTLNISANSMVSLPPVLFNLPSLVHLNASKNFIADVEVEALLGSSSLEQVNLEENPLNPHTHAQLTHIQNIRITLSVRQREEWEDLSI